MHTAGADRHFTLDERGRRLDVVVTPSGRGAVVRLLVDGEQVDQQPARAARARLKAGDVDVLVRWWWFGQIATCALVESASEADGEPGAEPAEVEPWTRGKRILIPFAPAPGTWGAYLPRLAYERPRLYASRHVVVAVLQVLASLLAIGTLFRIVLPRIDLSWLLDWLPRISIPRIDLPDIPWPSIPLPAWEVPAWVEAVVHSWKWWGPVLIAIVVAVNETKKRRRRGPPARLDAERRAAEEDA